MSQWRINLISTLILLFSVVIIVRLAQLQIFQADFYKAIAQGFNTFSEEVQGERGAIFLKNGESLAINKNWPLVFASPPKVTDPEKVAESLSKILNLPESSISEKLKKETLYSPIKNKLTEEEAEALDSLDLPGIYLGQERLRYFPQETLASQVVGFLDADSQGQYGLEEYFDETLRSSDEGTNLALTVDYNIQFTAEKLLAQAKENLNIERGQIIVLEPDSGRILALVNFPSFNPNYYGEYASEGNLEIFQNGATQRVYEPGSVFKSITMAAALNEKRITPQTTYVDSGEVKIGGYTIYNYDNRVWGKRTMTEVLERSINTGAVFVGKELGSSLFLKYIEKFGFFEPTGIDLPETYSKNKEFRKGYEINFATAAFGQGIEMTPIQLARAYSVIANGGRLVKPFVVEKISKKNEIIEIKPELSEPIIAPKIAAQLTAMLVSVVENGFGKAARVPGYYVAGKTGTAQVPYSALGINRVGYSDKTIQTFVGYAPAFEPRFLILVKLDNPETKTAEYSAVPIFRQLAKYIINYYQIPPDYE